MTGLYIHFPFCVKKCGYCDFKSYCGMETLIPDYITAVSNEADRYAGSKINTVFIGGGTPSLMNEKNIFDLFDIINRKFNLSDDSEITVEVNPDTVTDSKISAFCKCGVNRISMGAQSFCDGELRLLGRIHSAKRAIEAASVIKKYTDNYNIDIMTGIPKQTVDSLKYTLDTALSLSPSHLSCYSLIIEEGTEFFKRYNETSADIPDEVTDRKMYHFLCDYLEKNGFHRYEISNFAKDRMQCRHNLKYWDCEEYIGLGAAAHSYLNSKRFFNTSSIREYINGDTTAGSTLLDENDKISEFMIMGLRKARGISTEEFKKRFGKDFYDVFGSETEKHISGGFLEKKGSFLRLTRHGIDVSNSILCDFV